MARAFITSLKKWLHYKLNKYLMAKIADLSCSEQKPMKELGVTSPFYWFTNPPGDKFSFDHEVIICHVQ